MRQALGEAVLVKNWVGLHDNGPCCFVSRGAHLIPSVLGTYVGLCCTARPRHAMYPTSAEKTAPCGQTRFPAPSAWCMYRPNPSSNCQPKEVSAWHIIYQLIWGSVRRNQSTQSESHECASQCGDAKSAHCTDCTDPCSAIVPRIRSSLYYDLVMAQPRGGEEGIAWRLWGGGGGQG